MMTHVYGTRQTDPMVESNKEFGQKIRAMGLRGESAYEWAQCKTMRDEPDDAADALVRVGVRARARARVSNPNPSPSPYP